jgi:hypothetical protein
MGRGSDMRNMATPMESTAQRRGKPTERKAQSSSGERKLPEAKAGSRKARAIHNSPDRPMLAGLKGRPRGAGLSPEDRSKGT